MKTSILLQSSTSINHACWSRYRKFVVSSNGQPGGPFPSPPSSNPFNGWLIGILLSIILPFFRNKWGSLLQLKNKVEDVIETVEEVVEEVENVAEEVDKVAEEIGKDLPEGLLKDTLKAVENFSEETAKFAHAAGDIIDKVYLINSLYSLFLS
uniref:Uncharacterized protein isoform X2 n=1 Tax=Nicotiana tabacum TaxID=4097 RepID=A0A1S3ZDD6_TOBAC|nr:PREDICTED: uncharacterized protein LOC107785590 isoform X2 [Nicotiana tabacum]